MSTCGSTSEAIGRRPDDVTVVAVDAHTFSADPDRRWPFSRAVHAKIINNLTRAKPAAIAYDVQFTESSGNSQAAIDADNALLLAVRKARNVVLATTEVSDEGQTRIFGGGEGLAFSRATPSNSNYINDVDGRIRHVAFKIQDLRTFPLAAAAVAQRRPVATVPGRDSVWIDYPGGPGRIRTLHFSDVEAGRFPADARARQGRRGRRDRAVAAGPPPDVDDRQRADAGPGDPGAARHRACGLPAARRAAARGRPLILAARHGRAAGRHPRCACCSRWGSARCSSPRF